MVLMLSMLFKPKSNIINMEELPMDELKVKIKESIKKKLENPDISAAEIKTLAEAYTELTKNDYIKELWSNPMFGQGFGGCTPPDTSKTNFYPIKIISNNPYDEIANIIKKWCEANYYSDFVVTIGFDKFGAGAQEETSTEFLEFDGNAAEFIWLNDWWEGQKDIYLVGFRSLDAIKVYGFPEKE